MAGFAYGFDEGGAIPDDQGEKRGRKKSTFEQDIDAGRGPADTEQYGRPQYTDEVNESAGMDMSAPTPSSSTPLLASSSNQGAIPDDNSGAAPVMAIPEDNSGAAPVVAPQQQPQEAQSRSGLDFNAAHVPANAKRILQYLMGADAAHPQAADKFKQGVQAEHPGISESDANLVAVHKAGEAGGDDAAHQMLQYNRMAYNAKQSFAKAALSGVQGKPPDMQAAAGAATQASHHVLDGSNAVFVANPSGVTATVKMPGTNSRVSYNLTPQQFGQYLDVGGDGQWDKLMEQGGVPAALQKIVGSAQRPAAGGQQTAQADEDKGTQAPEQSQGKYKNSGVLDLSNGDNKDYSEWNKRMIPDHDPQDVLRAQRMFPGNQHAQEQWLAKNESEQATRENELAKAQTNVQGRIQSAKELADARRDAATTTGNSRVEAQRVRSESYAKAQQQKAQLTLQKMAQEAKSANERNRINVATRLINNPNWATQSADERNAILKNYGLDQLMEPSAPSTSVPQQTPPAAAPQPQQGNAAPNAANGRLQPPPAAIQYLKAHPDTRDKFETLYGRGSAQSVLGQ